ncbi:MAG: ATP-dependent zinc metalloprotease FtsH [Eubacterium sp.]|nr:ATP-dependent zinc metalloprotease FtsH [Eubacterium sp.]
MADNQNNQNKNGQEPNKNNRQTILMVAVCLLLSLMIFVLVSQLSEMNSNEISYDRFIEMVKADEIEKIELESNILTVTPKKPENPDNPNETYTVKLVGDENGLNELLQDTGIEYIKKTPNMLEEIISTIVSIALPLVIMLVGFNFIMRGMGRGGIMGVGKSKARNYVQRETGITFQDVAGEDEAKESLQEVVEFLHNPERYNQIGAILPKGALLVGPPGTGKTLLAKAVAGEAHVPFFSLSGSEFVEMFVGVGASRVRDLFEEAKKSAPCIIFIDEIDAIGKSRDSRYGGGNDEREQTLNQLLAEMDGFDSSKGLLILAATNRPEVLDPALLRPGRFDRRVIVDRPDLKGRIAILKVHAKDVLIDDTVDFEATALATSGAVGSDLANMINEAAILAVKNGRKAVSQEDLMAAVEVVLVGKEKKDRILSEEERRIVSYHEVGHALISALQKDAEPVQKITIIPRTMGALGYVLQVPEEEKYLNTKTELEAMVVGMLGGRAAEEIVFGNVTTGASNDIERATKLVRAMITQYGMSEKFGLMGLARVEHEYLSGRAVMDCGDATATEVDHEVMRILDESYQKAKAILQENRHALDEIAAYLITKETITGKEFMEILKKVQNGENEAGEAESESVKAIEERTGADAEQPGTEPAATGGADRAGESAATSGSEGAGEPPATDGAGAEPGTPAL